MQKELRIKGNVKNEKYQIVWTGDYEVYVMTQERLHCRCSDFQLDLWAEHVEILALLEKQLIVSAEGIFKLLLEPHHE